MWFFHTDQCRERICSDNIYEVLLNAPNSQQTFIDSDSEKGQFEPSLRTKLPMASFSACRKLRAQYNKTFIESHSSRLYGAKLLGEIGQRHTHTQIYSRTYALKRHFPTPSYFIPLTGGCMNRCQWCKLKYFGTSPYEFSE